MFDTTFSVSGFWLGMGLLIAATPVAVFLMFRWLGVDPERRKYLRIYAFGFITWPIVGTLAVYAYFPFFFWLADQLGF